MTERIKEIKEYQWEKRHHKARQPLPETLCFRDPGLIDTLRSALRTKQALDAEQPFLFTGEYIAFTRTRPTCPSCMTKGGRTSPPPISSTSRAMSNLPGRR